jgi:hypothetical protein
MGKLSGAHLDIVEEWTPVDPGDSQALIQEGKKLNFAVSILLKALGRVHLEEDVRAGKENERIRRKAGLAA